MRIPQVVVGSTLVALTLAAFAPSAFAAAAPGAAAAAQKNTVVSVDEVRAVHWISTGETLPHAEAGLGDWISLHVKNLDVLLQKTKGDPKRKLALYINGLELPGIEPVFGGGDPQTVAFVRFHLERTADSAAHWAELLGKPDAMVRRVQVSIGLSDCGAGCTDMAIPNSFDLIVIRTGGIVAFLLLALFVAGLLFKFGRSDMLRDSVSPPPDPPGAAAPAVAPAPIPAANRPFSLGRCQMAFWFFLVVTAFFFIWLVTGNLSSLTPSVLTLIGISAATGLGAVAIDANKRGADVAQRDQLAADQARLQASAATLQAAAAAAPAPAAPAAGVALAPPLPPIQAHLAATEAELAAVNSRAANWRPLRSQPHGRFLTDILSDQNGVSFHRLQILVWTLVLGVVFVVKVAVNLTMPDFDNTLLALMGISGGTYLGFKFPEQQV
jgi:hypothetical protein